MARSRNRVGVENGDTEPTVDADVLKTDEDAALVQKKRAMHKELLKKKKAERRAHAKQRKQAAESQSQRTDGCVTERETVVVEAHDTVSETHADESRTSGHEEPLHQQETAPDKPLEPEVQVHEDDVGFLLPERKKKKTKKKIKGSEECDANGGAMDDSVPVDDDFESEHSRTATPVQEPPEVVSALVSVPTVTTQERIQAQHQEDLHPTLQEEAPTIVKPLELGQTHKLDSREPTGGTVGGVEAAETIGRAFEHVEQQPSTSSLPSEAATLSVHEPEDPHVSVADENLELRPKKTKKSVSPTQRKSRTLSSDAAATTIQKALKKRVIQQTKRTLSRAKSLMRNSSKILAEDTLTEPPYQPPPQVRPVFVPPLALKPRPPPQSSSSEGSHSESSGRSSSEGSYSSRSSSESGSSASSDQEDSARGPMGPTIDMLLPRMPQEDVFPQRERKYGELHDFMATRIQAHVRGMRGRTLAQQRAEEFDKEIREEALREIEQEASVRIQARVKGYLQRKRLGYEDGERLHHRRSSKKHHHHKKTNSVQPHTPPPDDDTVQTRDSREPTVVEWPEELDLEATDDTWDDLNSMVMPQKLRATTALFLSKNKLRVFCGTWNLHAKKPKADLRHWIRFNRYHIVAVGTEECVNSIAKSVVFTSKKQWEDQLKETLGDDYVLVAAHSLTAIHNAVFVHESVLPFLHNIQSDAVATGLGNQLGNKGGVGIAFSIGHTSFAFVNCHFDAHQHNVSKRNANFHRINQELQLQPHPNATAVSSEASSRPVPGLGKTTTSRFSSSGISSSTAAGSGTAAARGSRQMSSGSSFRRRKLAVSECFDRVFWYGDLNYRINGTRRMIDLLLLHNQHAVLRFNDQLQIEMKRGTVFSHFQEGPLHFRPTYKFDKHSNVYDSGPKQRIPSWTDRILYLSNEKPQDVELLSYKSHMSFQTSDHRPVGASFEVAFRRTTSAPIAPVGTSLTESQHAVPTSEKTPEDTEQDFARVLAKGYKPSQTRSEVCVVQ